MHRRGSTARTDAVHWTRAGTRHGGATLLSQQNGTGASQKQPRVMATMMWCFRGPKDVQRKPSVAILDSCAIAGRVEAAAAKSQRGILLCVV